MRAEKVVEPALVVLERVVDMHRRGRMTEAGKEACRRPGAFGLALASRTNRTGSRINSTYVPDQSAWEWPRRLSGPFWVRTPPPCGTTTMTTRSIASAPLS